MGTLWLLVLAEFIGLFVTDRQADRQNRGWNTLGGGAEHELWTIITITSSAQWAEMVIDR